MDLSWLSGRAAATDVPLHPISRVVGVGLPALPASWPYQNDRSLPVNWLVRKLAKKNPK